MVPLLVSGLGRRGLAEGRLQPAQLDPSLSQQILMRSSRPTEPSRYVKV